jgi:ubiquinone/menaquinone biosynthesis C-methylase UbiE
MGALAAKRAAPMPEADTAFTGSIPETYDRYLGPLLFAPYGDDLARRARALGAERIVEIAAGTGIATRALASSLPHARIEATDLNDAMVRLASTKFDPARIRWSVADAMALGFPNGSFDVAVCQFGVMFFADPVECFREVRRVLSAGGTYLFNVWDDLAHNDVARIVFQTLVDLFPDDPPSFLARTPYGHGDVDRISSDLRSAGFSQIRHDVVERSSGEIASHEAALGFCEGTPLRHEILERSPNRLQEIVGLVTQRLQSALGESAAAGRMRAFVFTAS